MQIKVLGERVQILINENESLNSEVREGQWKLRLSSNHIAKLGL